MLRASKECKVNSEKGKAGEVGHNLYLHEYNECSMTIM